MGDIKEHNTQLIYTNSQRKYNQNECGGIDKKRIARQLIEPS